MSGTYRTRSGRVLTDADIEALADEAERGYDVSHLLARRRPRVTLVEWALIAAICAVALVIVAGLVFGR